MCGPVLSLPMCGPNTRSRQTGWILCLVRACAADRDNLNASGSELDHVKCDTKNVDMAGGNVKLLADVPVTSAAGDKKG